MWLFHFAKRTNPSWSDRTNVWKGFTEEMQVLIPYWLILDFKKL